MRAGVTLGVGVVAAAVALILGGTGVLDRLELNSVDERFAIRGDQPPPKDVVLVGIDDRTLDTINRQTPYPRSFHAKVIDALRRAGAAAIAYDIEFSNPSVPHEDAALLTAAQRAGSRLVLGTTVLRRGQPVVIGAANLRKHGVRIGYVNFPLDVDGAIRRMPATLDGAPQFALLSAQTASRRHIDPAPAEQGDGAWIDYPGPEGTVRAISFVNVLDGHFRPADVRGKLVVVGATSPVLQDQHTTSEPGVMSGPEINADAAHTALTAFPLADPPGWLQPVLALVAALVAPLATLRGRPGRALLRAAIAGAVGLVVLLVGTQVAFGAGLVIGFVVPLLALVLGTLGAAGVAYATEIRDRRRMRSTFERFVPKEVVGQLLDRPGASPRLPGQRVDATVLFCDLRGFTTLAESLDGDRVIAVLDRWFNEMGDAVLDHGGTLVSFQGDGMMAVFGAPVATPDHPQRALAAAQEMLDVRLPRFAEWLGQPVRMGIGVNTGPVMSGSVGSERRLEYAAVGDATNTAARLQALSKESEHQLFVAESTKDALGDSNALSRLGPVELRGRAEPIVVWTRA
jgi:adenylate cyclase